jgi:hypothetical protein
LKPVKETGIAGMIVSGDNKGWSASDEYRDVGYYSTGGTVEHENLDVTPSERKSINLELLLKK